MKINYNPCRSNTGAETEPQPNMWREDQPRAPPPTARPSTTAPSSSSTAPAANPTRNMVEEPTVPRKLMDKFQGLKPCLRKPCPWKEQCRNLHLPYGKLENEKNYKTRCKFYPYRRICQMSRQPAEQPLHRAETRKVTSTTEGEPEKSISGQEEEGHTPTVEGELPEKIQEDLARGPHQRNSGRQQNWSWRR